MLVQDLIDMLEGVNPNAEIKFAGQPNWPMEYTIKSDIYEADNGAVYLFEYCQDGYLASEARDYIGW